MFQMLKFNFVIFLFPFPVVLTISYLCSRRTRNVGFDLLRQILFSVLLKKCSYLAIHSKMYLACLHCSPKYAPLR